MGNGGYVATFPNVYMGIDMRIQVAPRCLFQAFLARKPRIIVYPHSVCPIWSLSGIPPSDYRILRNMVSISS